MEPYKVALSQFLHLSKDALHIHFGLAIFLAAAFLLRRPAGSWIPWFVLLGLELVNEWLDLRHSNFGLRDIGASTKDIVNTMFWPTVLLLAIRSGWIAVRAPGYRPPASGS